MSASFVAVGCKSWNRVHYETLLKPHGRGEWHYIGEKSELTRAALDALKPKYVFFLHWSWIVPAEIYENHRCVVFHMTDLPYGRGGSPLQNLIVRGHRETKLSALQMTGELDAGPIYLKRPLSLEGSSAEEIYIRAGELSCEMARAIAKDDPEPVRQSGEVTEFRRRTPE
ncbi:MAG: methionyl-tRNA formyltransferase, partial [Fimbriimonadaceae bacterium]